MQKKFLEFLLSLQIQGEVGWWRSCSGIFLVDCSAGEKDWGLNITGSSGNNVLTVLLIHTFKLQ